MPQASNIKEVLAALDGIIDFCSKNELRAGYFACLYRSMTVAVEEAITRNMFADGPRMEKLDVIFANLYLDAWHCFQNRQPCSRSWQTAFDAAAANDLAVVQQLLLGVNTHINLDLAIAAADTAPGAAIEDLHQDFLVINSVIASMVGSVYNKLCNIWFPLRLLGRITQNRHENVINFSIVKAREASWNNALLLAYAGRDAARKQCIDPIDRGVNRIAEGIIKPGMMATLLLKTVRWMEPAKPSAIMKLLNAP